MKQCGPLLERCFAQMVAEGLNPAEQSLLLVDPNSNALGVRLIEEVEASTATVTAIRADADRGQAAPYANFVKNDQLAAR